MNVRFKKNLDLLAVLVYDDESVINQYTFTISAIAVTDDPEELQTAFNRIYYWLVNVFNHAVLIDAGNPLINVYKQTNLKVISFPMIPSDQVVGVAVYCKLNAITEGKIEITDIEISSTNGEDVIYLHNFEETLGPMAETGWWQDTSVKWFVEDTDHDKIVRLKSVDDWNDLDLAWPVESVSGKVFYHEFTKNETK